MHIKTVINETLKLLELEDVDSESDAPEMQRIYDCANYIYAELTSQYVEMRKIESHVFKNGEVLYSEFEEPVKEICVVKEGDRNLRFRMIDDRVLCDGFNGEATIDYIYKGKTLNKNSYLSVPPFFSEHMLATGIASEYFLRTGRIDEYSHFRARYENWIVNYGRKARSYTIPRRRFIC